MIIRIKLKNGGYVLRKWVEMSWLEQKLIKRVLPSVLTILAGTMDQFASVYPDHIIDTLILDCEMTPHSAYSSILLQLFFKYKSMKSCYHKRSHFLQNYRSLRRFDAMWFYDAFNEWIAAIHHFFSLSFATIFTRSFHYLFHSLDLKNLRTDLKHE